MKQTIKIVLLVLSVTSLIVCFCIPSFAELPTYSLDTDYTFRISGTSSDPVYHYLTNGAYTQSRRYTVDWQSFGVMVCALDNTGNPITNLRVRITYDVWDVLYTSPDFTTFSYGAYGYTCDWDQLPQYGDTVQITIDNLPYDSFVIAFAFSDEYLDYFAEAMNSAIGYNYALSARLSAPNYYDDGYDDGYTVGENAGYQAGFNNGYNVGVTEYDNVPEAVFTIVSAPFDAITNFLNFEIFGINLKAIIAFLVMAIIVTFVIKKVKD